MPASAMQKPKGRMSAYTFFVQTCREEFRKSHPDQTVDFTEFSKDCAARWREMNDQDKIRFFDLANKDKIRYEREMDSYAPYAAAAANDQYVAAPGSKRKKKKDPNAPKRPLSAFFIFCADQRPKVKEEHPDFSVGDISKHLGVRWAAMSDDEKKQYHERNQTEKTRYQNEMQEYNAKPAPLDTLSTRPTPAKRAARQQAVEEPQHQAATTAALMMMQQHQIMMQQQQMFPAAAPTHLMPPPAAAASSATTNQQNGGGGGGGQKYNMRRM